MRHRLRHNGTAADLTILHRAGGAKADRARTNADTDVRWSQLAGLTFVAVLAEQLQVVTSLSPPSLRGTM
jgi:hypothetical protein